MAKDGMQTKGVVTSHVVNLYSQASKAVDVVTQAILGTEVAIWESREGWYYVRLPDQYQGWIEASHVRVYAPTDTPYASAGPIARVINLLAFLYYEPSVTAHAPALQVPIGARLEVAQEREDWIQVALPDRSLRWVQRGDVSIVAADTPRPRGSVQEVIATARRFLGLPYQWGGTTPLGLDCSGFVQLVYHLNGVDLLRDADIQYTQPGLQPVEKVDLQAGDLIFFGESSITHVGMYIGDGQFIHATTHGQPIVQISRLDEPHWTSLYQGARRPQVMLKGGRKRGRICCICKRCNSQIPWGEEGKDEQQNNLFAVGPVGGRGPAGWLWPDASARTDCRTACGGD